MKNMLAAKKSVYDYVLYDADNEAKFAEQLERTQPCTPSSLGGSRFHAVGQL